MGFLKNLTTRSKNKSTLDVDPSREAFVPARQSLVPARESAIPRHTPLVPSPTLLPTAQSHSKAYSKDYDSEASIVIGVDFGTTYSGIAWAYSKEPTRINIITDWDSAEYGTSDKGKAPTRVSYATSSHHRSARPSEMTWGYGVGDQEAVEWFKLLLLDDSDMDYKQKTSPQILKAKAMLQKANKTAVEAVTDFLRLLWAHAVANIEKQAGEEFVNGLSFKVVCTVPAIWRNDAISKMREAAKVAGILETRLAGETTLSFVSEPEAAAIATFEDLKRYPNIRVGDTFVVCDAGGGTVDLISYKVTQTDPMKLEECVEGLGKLCGAVFLDQEYEACIKQRIGRGAWEVSRPAITQFLNNSWENGIKRNFDGKRRDWPINLPYECTQRGAPHQLTLNHETVLDIFDHVTSQVRSLVNGQISAINRREHSLPKAVILVGGFGTICRGAVLKGFAGTAHAGPIVETRISRCNYGLVYYTEFDASKHEVRDKFIDNVTGLPMANNQLTWYLTRGTRVDETQPVKHEWYREVSAQRFRSTYAFVVPIVTSDDQNPPSRRESSVRDGFDITSNAPVDVSQLKTYPGVDGEYYKKVHFALEMKVIGTALEFTVIYDGKRVAHREVAPEVDNLR
ncbi:hypothetical protein E8E11_011099 [Didymella keratinophila]|nr:hypothetical protein E8E11_011099 [Didymella keratinophila]